MADRLALLSGNSYRNFIEAVNSSYSRKIYKYALLNYMSYLKLENCSQLLDKDSSIIRTQITDYVIHLRDVKEITSRSINTYLAAIKKFYETNDVDTIKWPKVKMYVGKKSRNKKDRPYTSTEISKMLEKADQRTRAVILLMSSSGIRVGAVPLLKMHNLEKIENYSLYKITVYEGEEEEYITFCTPEAATAIGSYLEYRKRYGEEIHANSPLIREQFDIRFPSLVKKPKPIGVETVKYMISRAASDSGVKQKTTAYNSKLRHPIKGAHGLRKFFQTTAITNGMSPLYSEFLMGHRSGGLAIESYTRPTERDLLEGNDKMIGYVGVIDSLTINEENKLRRKVETLTEKQNEIQKMKDKHQQEMTSMREEMNKQFSQIMSIIQQNPQLAQVKPEALTKKIR